MKKYGTVDLNGNALVGVATAAAGTSTQQAATTAFVAQAVSVVPDSALSANVPRLNAANTFAGKVTMNGGRQSAYTAKTAAYTVAAATDYCIHCTTGTFAVTLPTAVGIAGQEFIIKNSGAGTITVATTSSQTIDGAATAILSTQYGSLSVMSDGANYLIS